MLAIVSWSKIKEERKKGFDSSDMHLHWTMKEEALEEQPKLECFMILTGVQNTRLTRLH